MRQLMRRAGEALMDADAKYARAVDISAYSPSLQAGHAMPLRDIVDAVPIGDGVMNQVLGHGVRSGLMGANVAARYALPLGGMTLAGKGLMDLTGMFVSENEQTSGTIMPG